MLELSGHLSGLTPRDVVEAVAPAELAAAEIYPMSAWEDGETAWLVDHLERLAKFFRDAVNDGMGMLVWLD